MNKLKMKALKEIKSLTEQMDEPTMDIYRLQHNYQMDKEGNDAMTQRDFVRDINLHTETLRNLRARVRDWTEALLEQEEFDV
jgi:hypothetical protein